MLLDQRVQKRYVVCAVKPCVCRFIIRLVGERQMGDVLALNVDELDALLLSGETRVSVPEQAAAERVRSLPPWERM